MYKKVVLAAVTALLLVCASVAPVSAEIKTQSQVLLSEEIPYEVIVLACEAVEKEKIATDEVAMCWYREGLMTITKIGSGVYRVITPGNGVLILETDILG